MADSAPLPAPTHPRTDDGSGCLHDCDCEKHSPPYTAAAAGSAYAAAAASSDAVPLAHPRAHTHTHTHTRARTGFPTAAGLHSGSSVQGEALWFRASGVGAFRARARSHSEVPRQNRTAARKRHSGHDAANAANAEEAIASDMLAKGFYG